MCRKTHFSLNFLRVNNYQKLANEDFYVFCSIPTGLGAVHGTEIKIKKLISDDWYQFLNRKSVTAMDVSAQCTVLVFWGKFVLCSFSNLH